MAVSPVTFSASVTPLSTPPLPISATYDLGNGLWVIQFDQELNPQSIDHTAFTLSVNNQMITPTQALVVGNAIGGQSDMAPGPPASDEVAYSAIPPDVRNLDLLEAAAFTGFPMLVS